MNRSDALIVPVRFSRRAGGAATLGRASAGAGPAPFAGGGDALALAQPSFKQESVAEADAGADVTAAATCRHTHGASGAIALFTAAKFFIRPVGANSLVDGIDFGFGRHRSARRAPAKQNKRAKKRSPCSPGA